MNWKKVVTGDDGKSYLEIDAVALCPQRPGDGPAFIAVSPPGGVANIPVGPNAPAWLQGVVQQTVEYAQESASMAIAGMPRQQGVAFRDFATARAQILGQITTQSMLPGNGVEQAEVQRDGYTLDELEALRSDWNRANPSFGNPFRRAGLNADYVAVDEAKTFSGGGYEVVRADGEVVRREGDDREAAAYMEWPAPQMPTDLTMTVQRWLPGDDRIEAAKVYGRMGTIGGLGFGVSGSIPAGATFAMSDPVAPKPAPPEPGRFQNLDW